MRCKLYIRHQGQTIPLGTFRNRAKAADFFTLYIDTLKSTGGSYPEPIYVESGIRRKFKYHS